MEKNQKDQQNQVEECKHNWRYVGTSGIEKIEKCTKCGKTRNAGTDGMIVAAIIAGS